MGERAVSTRTDLRKSFSDRERFGAIRKRRIGVVTVAVLGAVAGTFGFPAGRQAVGAGGTSCTYLHEVTFTPGLSVHGSSGTLENTGGTIDCDGPFLGIEPTGPGSFHGSGSYGTEDPDTCQGGGEAAGEIVFTFPTAIGDQSVTSAWTAVYGSLSKTPTDGPLAVRVESDDWVAEGSATPIEGDCVARPVTRVRDQGVITTKR